MITEEIKEIAGIINRTFELDLRFKKKDFLVIKLADQFEKEDRANLKKMEESGEFKDRDDLLQLERDRLDNNKKRFMELCEVEE